MASSPTDTGSHTHVQRQEVIANLSQQALETADLDQLLHAAAAAVAETLDTDYCSVFELMPDEDEFVLREGVSWEDGLVGNATVLTETNSQIGTSLLTNEPVIVDDLRTDERFSVPEVLTRHNIVSGISVVIGSPDDPWGVLGTYTTQQRAFTEHDATFVKSVATVLASAIENERTQSEREEVYGRISDGFFALDEEWRFTYLNERAHEWINPEDRELAGKYVWEEFPRATEREFKPKYEQAMYEQETISFEEYYPKPLDAWFEVRAYPSETGLSVYFRDITDRKERELELERYKRIVEAVGDAIYVVDEDQQFQMVNQAAEELSGHSREQLLDASVADMIDEENAAWAADLGEKLSAEDQEIASAEFTLTTADGREVPIEVRFTPLPTADGHDERVGVARDITERKARERALEESERRYRTLAEYFPNGIVTLFDHDLRYELAAGQAFEKISVEPDEVEGRHFSDVWDTETATALRPAFEAALSGKEQSVELAYEGREWVVHAVPITDERGDVFAGMTMAQDITEQKERERELERALDLLEKTERIADVGGWEIDVDTTDVFWTDHVFDLLEVSSDEEPPLDEALDMYHEEDQPIVEDAVKNALDSGEPFDVEVRIRTDSGEMRWLRLQGIPETVDDDVVSLRGAAQDITERKQREQRLEELVDRLEESNERLEQFAYAASHDLQEPLRMVSSYLKLIESRYADDLDEDGQEFIEFAVDGADRMREMIEGLLAYSRVDTRGDPFEPVDLETVLADVREDLQVKIEESDAEITAESLPQVEGDPGQLRQLFQNLLDNAIEYSGDEPPRIDVTAECDGDEWVVSVRDEGIGIDPDNADRIFEVFQRLHTPDDHDGTGIGLALCRRIIERHGGEIWVDSEPGEGTTFSCTLPAEGKHRA